jgi:hypothetical protein
VWRARHSSSPQIKSMLTLRGYTSLTIHAHESPAMPLIPSGSTALTVAKITVVVGLVAVIGGNWMAGQVKEQGFAARLIAAPGIIARLPVADPAVTGTLRPTSPARESGQARPMQP